MKLIKPSVEILEQGPELQGIYDMIELCGKTSYKSPVKGGEEAKKFVEARINEGHLAVLEFGTVYFKIDELFLNNSFWRVWNNPYSKTNCYQSNIYLTTNYRVLVENDALDLLDFICEPTEYHIKRYCAKFITDRGVSHELVRHRTMSFCQESTRYCNYSKDKFGNELTFIEPTWYADSENVIKSSFDSFLKYSEDAYLDLLDHQYTPQQARQVLPNAIKTEICMCGFEEGWKHFFDFVIVI